MIEVGAKERVREGKKVREEGRGREGDRWRGRKGREEGMGRGNLLHEFRGDRRY